MLVRFANLKAKAQAPCPPRQFRIETTVSVSRADLGLHAMLGKNARNRTGHHRKPLNRTGGAPKSRRLGKRGLLCENQLCNQTQLTLQSRTACVSAKINIGGAMKKHIGNYRTVLLGAMILLVSTQSGLAAQTGWLSVTKLRQHMADLERTGRMPAGLICRTDPGGSSGPQVRVTSRKIKNKDISWHWAWGTEFKAVDKRLLRDGYVRVSTSSYKGLFGMDFQCGLWVRNPKQ